MLLSPDCAPDTILTIRNPLEVVLPSFLRRIYTMLLALLALGELKMLSR
jgi:hypothetical protein